eukprot:365825-Chlamydomonas_euryale.AAC.1
MGDVVYMRAPGVGPSGVDGGGIEYAGAVAAVAGARAFVAMPAEWWSVARATAAAGRSAWCSVRCVRGFAR